MLGAGLALLAAATFGMNIATARRGVLGGSVIQAIVVTNLIGVPFLLAVCALFGALDEFAGLSASSWMWFTSAGMVHFVLGRYATYRAASALGAAQSGPIQQVSLLISLALALMLLGESLRPLQVFGIVLILAGPIVIMRERARHGEVKTRAGQTLNYFEGYSWGLVCACAFGTSPLLIRFGIGDGGLATGIAGGLASYIAAAVTVIALMAVPAFRRDALAIDRKSAKWFSATGFFVCTSQLFVFMALSIAPVTIVQPIQRTALLFRVVFSWMLNRDHEVLGVSILIAIGLSMLGVLAVSLDIDVLVGALAISGPAGDFMRLAWP